MAYPRRTATIMPSIAAIEADVGPLLPHYAVPLDRLVLYQFVVGDASVVDHRRVLGCSGGGPGRWLQVGAYPIEEITATSTGAGGVVVSLPMVDNDSWQVRIPIVGKCTAGAAIGDVWGCVISGYVERRVGVATVAIVGGIAPSITYARDAALAALAVTFIPNVGTGAIDITLPGLAAHTIQFGGIVQRARFPL